MTIDVHDRIEEIYAEKYSRSRASKKNRKSIGDFWLSDTHAVNVKSNNLDKNNYSPNLVSASRVNKWLNKGMDLSFIFVDYTISNGEVLIKSDSGLVPVQNISWSCLSIQAQGKGVIQKSKPLQIKEQTKKDWLKCMAGDYLRFIYSQFSNLCELEQIYLKVLASDE